jgi:hypothetical protein
MSGWKHEDDSPALQRGKDPKLATLRELVIIRARELLGAKVSPKAQREARELLREAVFAYDRQRNS